MLWILIVFLILLPKIYEWMTMPDTFLNIVGYIWFVIIIIISWKTKCFTIFFNNSKNENNDENND